MVKIICPNKQYNGISASVPFTNGVGQTENPNLIKWFKEHGYTVEQDEGGEGGKGGGIADMNAKELKAYADEKKIDLGKAKSKADMIAAITKAETEAEGKGGENEPPKGDEPPDDSEDKPKDEGGEDKTE